MTERVTNLSISLRLTEALRRAQFQRFEASDRLSSGRLVNRYSDAPSDAAAIVRIGAQQSDWASFAKAANDATAWLNTQDNALQNAANIVHRARELTIAGASSTAGPSEREAIALELEHLRDRLAEVANSSYLGRSVFGGVADSAVANVAGTWTYVGDAGSVNRRVAPDVVVQVNGNGSDIFGFSSGEDVFGVLDRVAANVRSGDVIAVGGADLASVVASLENITNGLAVVGGRQNRVDAALETGQVELDHLRQNRSVLEDADLARSVMDLTKAETGYEATLAATARLSMTSLVDFLR